MKEVLPVRSNPWGLCDSDKCFDGRLPLARFARLKPFLISTEGEAVFTLRFGRHGKQHWLHGHIGTDLELICQRCLEALLVRVEKEFHLVLVSSHYEMALLPNNMDPLLVELDELISLQELIEDELLLSIPQSPMHEESECGIEYDAQPAGLAEAKDDQKTPFAAALADLKNEKLKS